MSVGVALLLLLLLLLLSFLLGFPNLTGCVCFYARLSPCNVSPTSPPPPPPLPPPLFLFLTQVATVKTVRRTRDIIKARREAAAAALIIPMFEEGYPRIVDLDDTSFLLEVGGHNRERQDTPLHACNVCVGTRCRTTPRCLSNIGIMPFFPLPSPSFSFLPFPSFS